MTFYGALIVGDVTFYGALTVGEVGNLALLFGGGGELVKCSSVGKA